MLQIQATYQKRLGLPGYSSHAYTVSVTAEISSLRKLQSENERLYRLLQSSVDEQLKTFGFVPEHAYGMSGAPPKTVNGSSAKPAPKPLPDDPNAWACSDKQRAFIEKVANREKFTPTDLDGIAQNVCQLPVRQLDKRQASRFIDELLKLSAPIPFRRNGTAREHAAARNDGDA